MKLISSVPLKDGQIARLLEIAPGAKVVDGRARSPEEVAELLTEDAEIVYTYIVPESLMDRAPNLRWLQLLSAGCDHIADNKVMDAPVLVSTASGIHATPIAEHVLSLILALFRMLPQSIRAQQQHTWLPQRDFMRGARELRGCMVGVVGYGGIGREVARIVKAFGARVVALKRDPSSLEAVGYSYTGDADGSIPEKFYGLDELTAMVSECDVVVLAIPKTDETENMMASPQFDVMKRDAIIIDVSRGGVVGEGALIEALNGEKIAGAALDVFGEEPLPSESPLWEMANVIITPHVAGATPNYLYRAFDVLAENLRRYTMDEPLLNLVDRDRGY